MDALRIILPSLFALAKDRPGIALFLITVGFLAFVVYGALFIAGEGILPFLIYIVLAICSLMVLVVLLLMREEKK